MNREGALLVMIAVAVALLALGAFAWRRRSRRDAGITAPFGEVPDAAAVQTVSTGFYVATTRHGDALERLAIRGLGFRSRVDVTVTDCGVALDLVGQPRMFVTTERIVSVGQATTAIDRVVEPGGLVRLAWRAERTDGTTETVDSYLRPQDQSAQGLAAAITAILPPSTPTATDQTSTTSTGNAA
ncbi:hypothetical protein DEU37_1838 [Microbacterium sp. AG790]|uniref:PH-like domain-containing protein n=1 Tax=Microbacterium sp. AG790 TaxID=2183995 RepID=UPI000EB138BB|nr:hypothetical protein [Microbacterium sp. AG790]RKS89522.1 hypothetical protein DEU37_1838 [Microbacterium sp. AG790]